MKELFVIIDGEYSDWNIIGYTDSEEEATQICVQHNEKLEYGNSWYYDTVGRIESPNKKVPLQFIHTIHFDRTENGVKMSNHFDEIEYFSESSKKSITKTEVLESWVWITARVPLKKVDWERAKKIAQDEVYKYLYEKNVN